MALIVDPTDANYNSYVTEAEADVLIAALDPFVDLTKWAALTSQQKENVILAATDNLNSFDFSGTTSSIVISKNNMMWPRQGASYANGVAISSSEIPVFVQEYIAKRSTEILDFGPADANSLTVPNNVKRQKLGGLEQEFFGPKEMTANSLSLSDFCSFGLIKPYVLRNGSVIFLKRA